MPDVMRTPPMLAPKHHALLDEAARRGLASADDIGLCFQLLSLANAIDRDCAARLAPKQLSEGKFVVLFLLHEQAGGLSPHQLADGAGVTRATITGLVDGLERDGFVRREPGPGDRRMVRVTLTAKGKSAAAKLFKEHTDWIGSLFGGLGAADKARLSDLLARVWHGTDTGRAAFRKGAQ
ncbi:MarR family transcriptional regulator [Achromobacter sp. MYb9]|nr:MarR family transcriptional regulator [Achromobacter sp. MYb9]